MSWIWQPLVRAVHRRGEPSGRTAPADRRVLRLDRAFAYRCGLTMREQWSRLNAVGPLEWIERDSHWYGDYISARVRPKDALFKIYEEIGEGDDRYPFALTVKLSSDPLTARAEMEEVLKLARDVVLASLDATDVREVPPFD